MLITDCKLCNAMRFFALAALLVLGLYVGRTHFAPSAPAAPPQLASGTALPAGAKPTPAVTLKTNSAPSGTNDALQQDWQFVYFGFLSCPDICPGTLYTLAEVAAKLDAENQLSDDTGYLFVSVDPERDQIEQLGQYVNHFDPRFRAATGELDQLSTLARSLGVVYAKVPLGDDYTMDHSSGLFLLSGDGDLRAVFPAPHDASEIVEDYLALRAAS